MEKAIYSLAAAVVLAASIVVWTWREVATTAVARERATAPPSSELGKASPSEPKLPAYQIAPASGVGAWVWRLNTSSGDLQLCTGRIDYDANKAFDAFDVEMKANLANRDAALRSGDKDKAKGLDNDFLKLNKQASSLLDHTGQVYCVGQSLGMPHNFLKDPEP